MYIDRVDYRYNIRLLLLLQVLTRYMQYLEIFAYKKDLLFVLCIDGKMMDLSKESKSYALLILRFIHEQRGYTHLTILSAFI